MTRKLYFDIAFAIALLYIFIRHTVAFFVFAGILVGVWFLVFSKEKREELIDKFNKIFIDKN